jgi:hypothetical protein
MHDRASMLANGPTTRSALLSLRRRLPIPIASLLQPFALVIRRLREEMKWCSLSIARLVAG